MGDKVLDRNAETLTQDPMISRHPKLKMSSMSEHAARDLFWEDRLQNFDNSTDFRASKHFVRERTRALQDHC